VLWQRSSEGSPHEFDPADNNNTREDSAKPISIDTWQDSCADKGSDECAECYWACDLGLDLATMKIDRAAGGGGDTDHEVAGSGADLERQPHEPIHGEDLDDAATDADHRAEHTRAAHEE